MTPPNIPDEELLARYKQNYHFPPEADITIEMIIQHWQLEQALTRKLLASTPENRWQTFTDCYSELYRELTWLNESSDEDSPNLSGAFKVWEEVIGPPPQKIYEIGSGKGQLIEYLAQQGYHCWATEITPERGEKLVKQETLQLEWRVTDGVHMEKFEKPNSFDVVLSNQVVEHIHPDDILAHFAGVYTILKAGGRYLFSTPHRHIGPSDVSRVFKVDQPLGMHLKEYTYAELKSIIKNAGYDQVQAVLSPPASLRRMGIVFKPLCSQGYLNYLILIEKMISLLKRQSLRRRAAGLGKLLLFKPTIMIVASKG